MVLDSLLRARPHRKSSTIPFRVAFPASSNAILKHPSCSCIVAVHAVPVLHFDTTVTFRALSRPESSLYDLVKHFCGVDKQ